jgi:phospholipid-transporting ATPase
MITSAHIGIGILGVEGRQAARASDYAISQFSYLKRLLFVHGRESYRKNSYVVCYNFYKNVLFVVPQFWFGSVSYFSGQTLYEPWIYQLYNMLFTCFPIIWFGIYDKEISADLLMIDTQYYVQGIVGKLFHSYRFWKWVIYGMIQAFFVYFFSFNMNSSATNLDGMHQDIWSNGKYIFKYN